MSLDYLDSLGFWTREVHYGSILLVMGRILWKVGKESSEVDDNLQLGSEIHFYLRYLGKILRMLL